MSEKFDYNNFDKIVVTIKREKEESIVKDYSIFGWQKIEVSDDDVFYDVIHVTFCRPHVINDKDELLYLQVCYEEKINEVSNLERYKNTASSILYGVLLTLSLTALIFGVVHILKFSNTLLGILLILGCVLSGGVVVPINKLRKKENNKYTAKFNATHNQIQDILNRVKKLSGVKDEK